MATQATDGFAVAGGAKVASPTFFVQECPTCGRRLHIRVEYLGRRVICEHCHGRFVARDPACRGFGCEPGDALMRRAEELLESASRNIVPQRVAHPR